MRSRAYSRLRTVRQGALGDSALSLNVAERERPAVAVGVGAPCAAAEHYPELIGPVIRFDIDRATRLPNTSSTSMQ